MTNSKQKEPKFSNRTVDELADVLVRCFESDVDKQDDLLHEDFHVTKKLKQHLGSKAFKEYDLLDEKQWKEAWWMFENRNVK